MDGITESRQKPRVIDGDCRQQPCSIKGVAAQGLHSSHLHGRGTVQGAELAPLRPFSLVSLPRQCSQDETKGRQAEERWGSSLSEGSSVTHLGKHRLRTLNPECW